MIETAKVETSSGDGVEDGRTPDAAVGTSTPLFEARGLGFSYGKRVVLDDVSLQLAKGEILGLLGPNGSGKSTAFGIVSGLLAAQKGGLSFEGNAIPTTSRKMRRAMGVVFQNPSIDKRLTCRQNLELAARLYAIPRAEVRERVDRQLQSVGLWERADENAEVLSGGMSRRLDIARALIHEPRLLIMDEPTAGLDEASFRGLWERLEQMRGQRELSILVATHRPEEAERCHRVMILNEGVVVATNTPSALRAKMSSELLFLKGEDLDDIVSKVRGLSPDVVTRVGAKILAVERQGDSVCVECETGHALIPRIVETFAQGRLSSVELRQPSLADVFLKVTGHTLWEDWTGRAAEVEP
jgi:ABC-2 type transport system ATP-binding protein